MLEFRFAFPLALVLLIPAALLLFRHFRGSVSAPPALRYSDTRLLGGLPIGLRVRLRRLPDALRLIAWILLVVALARPQFGDASETISGEGIDIMLAMDISDSMGTQDFSGITRFEAAKNVLRDFIDGRNFDHIGLVVFAEDAFYQAPPTLDSYILQEILDQVPLAGSVGLSNRTAIGLGIAQATNVLRERETPSRIIILLTDGASNAGAVDPVSASQAAATYGIRIYTVGLGTSEGDPQNALDEDLLRRIARITDGEYFNALSLEDLRDVYEQIDQLEPSTASRDVSILWQDQAWGLLILALILLVVERVLRQTLFQSIP